jgi:hypothetical protein
VARHRALHPDLPQQVVDQFTSRPFDQNQIGAGVDLSAAIAAGIAAMPLPDPVKEQLLVIVPNIVAGIYDAMSAAIGSVFWLGVGAAVLAVAAAVFIHEIPLRAKAPAPAGAPGQAAAHAGANAPGVPRVVGVGELAPASERVTAGPD